MKRVIFIVALAIAVAFAIGSVLQRHKSKTSTARATRSDVPVEFTPEARQAFAALGAVDTHAHAFQSAAALYDMLKRLNVHILDILVVSDESPESAHLEPHRTQALDFVRKSDGHAALCTTFDPYKFGQPNFTNDTIRQINQDFAQGAVAVKIWKNIGMEIKNAQGQYVMADDPALEPIYKDIAAHKKTLVAHLAEPDSCWLPPDPSSPDYEYYRQHPEWYMFRHPDHPKKETILAARDHVLEMNPNLRVVGAHLGSMETDVDQIAQRFDKYPNFAVDTAARVPYLMIEPREKVRNFLIKYQDRVIYGTDEGLERKADAATGAKDWEETYAHDWKFFSTDAAMTYKGRQVRGLALPPDVLKKLFHDNAVRWLPGITGQGQ